jgi:putative cardiolipin synthase
MLSRAKKIALWVLVALLVLVGSGVLLANRLTPQASGKPSQALQVVPGQTALDAEVEAILGRRPAGMSGALLVSDGVDAFAARALSARQAGRSLDLMYYIWHDDLTGRLLGREAWLAAERGVRVRLLLDDINAVGKDPALMALEAHRNIEVRLYNPFRNRSGVGRLYEMLQRVFSLNHRMHNKAWIADNRVAVVGGRNIGVEYFQASQDSNFHDLDLVLFGPAVQQASGIFDSFWNSNAVVPLSALAEPDPAAGLEVLGAIRNEARSPAARAYLDRVDASPTVRAYAAQKLTPFYSDDLRVESDPPVKAGADSREGWLVDRIAASLASARHKALLVSPYFVPGDQGTAALTGLARRGVQVGVVTNSLAANDVIAVHGGYSQYREPLLEAGVQLYEIRAEAAPSDQPAMEVVADAQADDIGPPARRGSGGVPGSSGSAASSGSSLHTKAFVVDDARGFVGSFNMDPRSATLNTEMGVFFDDPDIAAALRAEYLHLSGPALSDWVFLDGRDKVRWLDRTAAPPQVLQVEPGSTAWQRLQARVLRWLPLESQL